MKRRWLLGLLAVSAFAPSLALAQAEPAAIYSEMDRVHPVFARHGMVASQEETATRTALEVLKNGGNAVDATVTAAFTLAVTLPRAGNLGGGGFMIVHDAKGDETVAID
ncbi:MAG: gamma-glutamyltransferase, partial [Geminicoccales bacterium]